MLHHWKNKQGLLKDFSKINIYRSYTDAIQNKELNNMTGSWELFLPGFCLNVHFLEVYTDVSDVLSACKWSIKYSIMLVVVGDRKDLQPASHLHCKSNAIMLVFMPQNQILLTCRQRTSGHRQWLHSLSFTNQWVPLTVSTSAERSRGGEQRRGFEDQCTYVERHPKLWCVLRHERCETKGFQLASPLLGSEKSPPTQEATWERHR